MSPQRLRPFCWYSPSFPRGQREVKKPVKTLLVNPNNSKHLITENSTYRMENRTFFPSFFSPTTVSIYYHGRSCFAIHPSFFWLLLAADKKSTGQSRGTIFLSYHSLLFSVCILHTHKCYFHSFLLLLSFLVTSEKSVTCCSISQLHTRV